MSKTKEITIEPSKAEKLLKEAKAEVAKPVTPTKKLGRPPKVKPDATLTRYKGFPLATEIDKGLCFILNVTYTKPNLMKPEDTQIGEAIVYMMEYYGWRVFEHPILIIVFAIFGTFWTAWQKKEEAKKPKTEVKPKEKPE